RPATGRSPMTKHLLLSTTALLFSAGLASAEVVLNRGNDTDPATLDHHRTSTVAEGNVLRDLYEGLTVQNGKGEAVPGAAESWTGSEGGRVETRPEGGRG